MNMVLDSVAFDDYCNFADGRVFVWGEQQDGKILHEPAEVAELLGIPITRGKFNSFLGNSNIM